MRLNIDNIQSVFLERFFASARYQCFANLDITVRVLNNFKVFIQKIVLLLNNPSNGLLLDFILSFEDLFQKFLIFYKKLEYFGFKTDDNTCRQLFIQLVSDVYWSFLLVQPNMRLDFIIMSKKDILDEVNISLKSYNILFVNRNKEITSIGFDLDNQNLRPVEQYPVVVCSTCDKNINKKITIVVLATDVYDWYFFSFQSLNSPYLDATDALVDSFTTKLNEKINALTSISPMYASWLEQKEVQEQLNDVIGSIFVGLGCIGAAKGFLRPVAGALSQFEFLFCKILEISSTVDPETEGLHSDKVELSNFKDPRFESSRLMLVSHFSGIKNSFFLDKEVAPNLEDICIFLSILLENFKDSLLEMNYYYKSETVGDVLKKDLILDISVDTFTKDFLTLEASRIESRESNNSIISYYGNRGLLRELNSSNPLCSDYFNVERLGNQDCYHVIVVVYKHSSCYNKLYVVIDPMAINNLKVLLRGGYLNFNYPSVL